jgi:hypothetical protein
MPETKDAWDKLDILLKPVGGIVAGVAVASIGYLGTQYLKEREVMDTNSRVFAQIVSQREDADSNLRMNMFRSVFEKFYNDPLDRGQQVLSLELLAHNFHETLDLAPLFKRMHADLRACLQEQRTATTASVGRLKCDQDLLRRLERVAKQVNLKQAATLSEGRHGAQGTVFLDDLARNPQGLTVIERKLDDRWFKVEVLQAYPDDKELKVKLTVLTRSTDGGEAAAGPWISTDRVFNVGFFDFPMIDNTRLSNGKRAGVILLDWSADVPSAEVQLIYFPGSRASLKEKQYYDEMLRDLLTLNRAGSEAR